jgi:CheY-like chemotaxis protein
MDKILLIDDLAMHRDRQKGILSSAQVHVLTASAGDEALAVARRERPNLIVMGGDLPDMDGVSCCREIKTDPLLKHIPVIMLTNAVKSAEFDNYRAAGFTDFLPKPIDSKMYFSTVKKYIPSIERRRVRVPLFTEVMLTGNYGFHVGMTKDIGPKGIYVTSELEPSPDEEFRVSFMLPGSVAPTEVRSKVAWFRNRGCKGDSGVKPGFGVEFLEITGKGNPFHRKCELDSFVSRQSGAVAADLIEN